MLVKIVGIQLQDYKLENGYAFKGNKVHCIDLETRVEGQIGCQVMDFKISHDSPLSSVPLQIDKEYKLYFDKKGRVDFLCENEMLK